MKKLIFAIILVAINFATFGQKVSPFKPVPKDLFTRELTIDRTIQGQFLWRFSAQVTAVELRYNKDLKQFESQPLSSVGPAIGFRHFTTGTDGLPVTNWGVNAALLMGTDINNVDPASLKIAVTADVFKLAFGLAYTFNSINHFGILLGANIVF